MLVNDLWFNGDTFTHIHVLSFVTKEKRRKQSPSSFNYKDFIFTSTNLM